MPEKAVLADTSVWIEYFRRRNRPLVRRMNSLMDDLRLSVTAPVVAELAAGTRNDADLAEVESLLDVLPCLPVEQADWIAGGCLARDCRHAGRSVPVLDCLLAAVAMRSDHFLWTLDRDFDRLSDAGLKRFEP